jgi:hypothetical protein
MVVLSGVSDMVGCNMPNAMNTRRSFSALGVTPALRVLRTPGTLACPGFAR